MEIHDETKKNNIGDALMVKIPFNQPILGAEEVNSIQRTNGVI